MAAFVLTMALLAMIQQTMVRTKTIRTEAVKYYDQYKSEETLAYYGGEMVVLCDLLHPCDGDEVVELKDPKDISVKTEQCQNGSDIVRLAIPINNETRFGDYKCSSAGFATRGEAVHFLYRTCSKEETSSGMCSGDAVCMVTNGTKPTCGKPTIADCNKQHPSTGVLYCYEERNIGGRASLCYAIADGKYATIFSKTEQNCLSVQPEFSYDEHQRFYNKPFQLKKNLAEISIYCRSETDGAETNVTIKGSNGTILFVHHTSSCRGLFRFNLNESIFDRADILQIETVFTKQDNIVARMSHRGVVTGGKVIMNTTKKDNYDEAVYVDVEPTPDKYCQPVFKCTDADGQLAKVLDNGMVEVKEPSEYKCGGFIVCRSPDQGEEFAGDFLNTESVNFNPRISSTTPSKKSSEDFITSESISVTTKRSTGNPADPEDSVTFFGNDTYVQQLDQLRGDKTTPSVTSRVLLLDLIMIIVACILGPLMLIFFGIGVIEVLKLLRPNDILLLEYREKGVAIDGPNPNENVPRTNDGDTTISELKTLLSEIREKYGKKYERVEWVLREADFDGPNGWIKATFLGETVYSSESDGLIEDVDDAERIGTMMERMNWLLEDREILQKAKSVITQPNAGQPNPPTTDDVWTKMESNSLIPPALVIALDRPLFCNDDSAKTSYVALWDNNGEPVYGRARDNNGRIEAWFAYGGQERHSSSINGAFSVLAYFGPPRQNFHYQWFPINQLNSLHQPVRQQNFVPAVVWGLEMGTLKGEALGMADLARQTVWIVHGGSVHEITGVKYRTSLILCRVEN